MTNLLSPWPHLLKKVQAVASVLESGNVNYWTGSQGKAFEKEFATWSGSPTNRLSQRVPSSFISLSCSNIVDGVRLLQLLVSSLHHLVLFVTRYPSFCGC